MIRIGNLRKAFGSVVVLNGIDLTIEKSELVCLIGASGSGKSTLLQCIIGLEPIQGGEILVDGISVHDPRTDINKLRQKLGIVFQQYNAFPHLTALENVALAPRVVAKRSRAEARALARKHLDHVGLGDKADSLHHACPAASSSVSPSPERLRWSRATCSSTRLPPPWIQNLSAKCWKPCAS